MPNDSMVVIAAVARKGGSGKSTLVKAFASATLAAGRTALLIDTDPQGDLTRWVDRAAAAGMAPPGVRFVPVRDTRELEATIDDAYTGGGVDFVFIDTAGAAGAWTDDIAMLADYLVTPVLATLTDLEVGRQTVEWFRGLHRRVARPEDLPPHRVVLTRFPTRVTKLEREVARQAVELFPVVDRVISDRHAYLDMDARGFLGEILHSYQTSPNPLERRRARQYQEALVEATDVLNDILAA